MKIVVKFGEHAKPIYFNESGNLRVDPTSIAISERAERIMKEDNVSFGEALTRARREVAEGVRTRPDFNNQWVEIDFEGGTVSQTP